MVLIHEKVLSVFSTAGSQKVSEGSYALIGIRLVILLLCEILELIAICLMGNVIVYIDI